MPSIYIPRTIFYKQEAANIMIELKNAIQAATAIYNNQLSQCKTVDELLKTTFSHFREIISIFDKFKLLNNENPTAAEEIEEMRAIFLRMAHETLAPRNRQ